jgi:hypothetical protein
MVVRLLRSIQIRVIAEMLCRAYAQMFPPVVRRIPDDLHQPGPKVFRRPAIAKVLDAAHESLLARIFGIGGLAQAGQRHQVSGASVPAQENIQRGDVASEGPANERGI